MNAKPKLKLPSAVERWLSPEDCARRSGFCRETIYRALASGDLPGYKPGRRTRSRWRIKEGDFDAWVEGDV